MSSPHSQWVPSAVSIVLMLFGLLGCGLFALLGLAVALDGEFASGAVSMGMLGMPLLAAAIFIAAFTSSGQGIRGALLALSAATFAAGGAVSFGAMALTDDPIGAASSYTCLCLTPSLAVGVAGLLVMSGAPRKAREHARHAQLASIRSAVANAGFVDLTTLPGDPDAAATIVHDMLRRCELNGELFRNEGLFAAPWYLDDLERKLGGRLEARGRVDLGEFGLELGVPPTLLDVCLHRMAERNELDAAYDAEQRVAWSEDAASQMAKQDQCPRCAAKLRFVGRGIARCDACGTERFATST